MVAQDEDMIQSKSERAVSSKQVCEEKKDTSKGKLKMEESEDLTSRGVGRDR